MRRVLQRWEVATHQIESGVPGLSRKRNVPQAWSSGAVIQLVVTLLGLDADANGGVVHLHPALPEWMSDVSLRQLRIGEVLVDLHITSRPDGTHGVDVLGGGNGLEVKMLG